MKEDEPKLSFSKLTVSGVFLLEQSWSQLIPSKPSSHWHIKWPRLKSLHLCALMSKSEYFWNQYRTDYSCQCYFRRDSINWDQYWSFDLSLTRRDLASCMARWRYPRILLYHWLTLSLPEPRRMSMFLCNIRWRDAPLSVLPIRDVNFWQKLIITNMRKS